MVMRIVSRGVDREAAAGAVLEALIDRQDDHLAGAAEPPLHQDAGEVRLHAGIGAFIFVDYGFDCGRDGHAGSPKSVRAPPIAGAPARQMLDSIRLEADDFSRLGRGQSDEAMDLVGTSHPVRLLCRHAGRSDRAAGRPTGARFSAHDGRRQPCPAFGASRPGRGPELLGDLVRAVQDGAADPGRLLSHSRAPRSQGVCRHNRGFAAPLPAAGRVRGHEDRRGALFARSVRADRTARCRPIS